MAPKRDPNRLIIQGLVKECQEKTTKVLFNIRDPYDDNGMPIVKAADPNDGEVPSTAAEENDGAAQNTRKSSGQSKVPGIKNSRGSNVVRPKKLDYEETSEDEELLNKLLGKEDDNAEQPAQNLLAEVSCLVDGQFLNPVVKKQM